MKQIPLTRGLFAEIDDEDYDRASKYKWCAMPSPTGNCVYALHFPHRVNGKRKAVVLHRFLLDAPAHLHVDHIDGNGLNCRRSNLRFATHSQNQFNRDKQCNNTSGYKGVTWDSHAGKWRAQIVVNGKLHYLGRYSDLLAAARAYNIGALQYCGEFARLNKIPANQLPVSE